MQKYQRALKMLTSLTLGKELPSYGLLLGIVLDSALEIAGADMVTLQVLHADELKIEGQRGFERPFVEFFDVVHNGQAACGTALKNGCRTIVEEVSKSPVFMNTESGIVMLDAGSRAVQSTPLCSASGQVLGILSTHSRAARRFNAHHFASDRPDQRSSRAHP